MQPKGGKRLQDLFRHKVFKMLLREKKISRELVDKLLSWKNSGFNIHDQVKIQSHDIMDARAQPNISSAPPSPRKR